jgi:hypothetical protein
MIGDDGQHAAIVETVAENWQRRLERLHLVIHSDSQGLKNPREFTST